MLLQSGMLLMRSKENQECVTLTVFGYFDWMSQVAESMGLQKSTNLDGGLIGSSKTSFKREFFEKFIAGELSSAEHWRIHEEFFTEREQADIVSL
jgi:hypothetical protein